MRFCVGIAAVMVFATALGVLEEAEAAQRERLGREDKWRIVVDKVMQPEVGWVTEEWMVKAASDAGFNVFCPREGARNLDAVRQVTAWCQKYGIYHMPWIRGTLGTDGAEADGKRVVWSGGGEQALWSINSDEFWEWTHKYIGAYAQMSAENEHLIGVFNKYTVHRKMVSVLQQLIGSDVKCIQSIFLDKPPGLGVGQPYHQDSYYLKTDPETLLAAWIACDDADPENGGLFVVPGSHHDPVQPHEEPVDPTQRNVYVEVRSARSRREQAVPLKAGSAVFFPGHMLHRSGHNRTDRRRRAFALHYANAKSRWLNDPTALKPFLSVCGREYPGCL